MRKFDSNTFVCFIDISGFKKQLESDMMSAGKMLDIFYSAGYNALKKYSSLNGIFISDCGIIYPDKGTESEKLNNLLGAIKAINTEMLNENFLTTTSIAFGYLEYRKKFVFNRIKKNAIIGSGYLNAFQDNNSLTPKLNPGQARITKNLTNVNCSNNFFEKINFQLEQNRLLVDKNTHYYFNWCCGHPNESQTIESIYSQFASDNSNGKYDSLKNKLKQARELLYTQKK